MILYFHPYGTHGMPIRSDSRFTDAYIKNLKPTNKRYDVYDGIATRWNDGACEDF